MRPPLKWLLLLLAAGLPLAPAWSGAVEVPPALAQERKTESQKTGTLKPFNLTPLPKSEIPLSLLKQNSANQPVLFEQTGTLAEGDAILDDGSFYDTYFFQGQAGQTIRIILESTAFDTYLILENPLGEQVAENDDGSSGTDAEIVIQLPHSGQYRILANALNKTGRGAYRLFVTSANEQDLEANQLFQEGLNHLNRSEFSEALQSWQSALEIYRAIEDRASEGIALWYMSVACQGLGQYEKALDYAQRSLTLAQDLQIRELEATSLFIISQASNQLANSREEYQQALDYAQRSLALAQDLQIQEIELGSLFSISTASFHLANSREEYQQVLNYALQSLSLAQEIQNQEYEAGLMLVISQASVQLANSIEGYQQALVYAQQSLTLAQELKSKEMEGYALLVIGSVYIDALSKYQEGLDATEEALAISRQIGDSSLAASALIIMSFAHVHLGNYEKTIEIFEQALDFAEASNDKSIEAMLYIPAYAYVFLGEYDKAIKTSEISLSRAVDIGLYRPESHSLAILGLAYLYLGDYEKALDFSEQSLAVAQENQDRLVESNPLFVLGAAYIQLNQYQEGVQFAERSVQIAQEFGMSQIEVWGLITLASGYVALGRHQDAVNISFEALQLTRHLGDKKGEADALRILGYTSSLAGDYKHALNYYQQALTLFQETGNRNSEGLVYSHIGRLLADQNQPEVAIIFLKKSVNVRESIRDDIQDLSADLQQSFADTVADDYRFLANLLLEQNRFLEAQKVLELLKIEELREFTRATYTTEGLQYDPLEQAVVDAHGSLVALGAEIYACDPNCPETLYNQQIDLKRDYDQQVVTFEATVRQNRADDQVFYDPATLASDALDIVNAQPGTVLIYPLVLEDRLWLLWTATGGVVGRIEVPVTQAEISRVALRFRELLEEQDPESYDDFKAVSRQLYGWLIEPIAAELEQNNIRHLVFAQDRVTRYLPMAALYDGNKYLIEHYTVSTVLSAALTDTSDRLGDVDSSPVLGLGLTQALPGFSPLPNVAEELEAVIRIPGEESRGIYPGQIFLDEAFTFEALSQNIRRSRILHIATHAEFVPGARDASYLMLGNGEQLRIADISAIEGQMSNLHMVVLSACQTALGGEALDGTEIAGVSSYFLGKNKAETVLATLWKVDDAGTSLLMQRFYALLATGQVTKAEALRQAQLSLLLGETTLDQRFATLGLDRGGFVNAEVTDESVGLAHPYYWAPFILIGNGL